MLQSLSPAGNFRFSFVAFEGTACPCCAFGFVSGWGVLEGLFSWGHSDKHIHNSGYCDCFWLAQKDKEYCKNYLQLLEKISKYHYCLSPQVTYVGVTIPEATPLKSNQGLSDLLATWALCCLWMSDISAAQESNTG